MNKKLRILVLATGFPNLLVNTIRQFGHNLTVADPTDFDLYLSDSTRGFDSLYLRGRKITASDFDAVISRIGGHRSLAEKILHHLQHNLNIFCVQSGESIEICADKFTCAQIMSENSIKVPKQFYSCNPDSAAMIVEKLGGLPIILKELDGSKGKGIILLESELQTNMTLQSYLGSERKIILQEYIDNGNIDQRHIVCNGEIVNSMMRTAPGDDVRANLSLNGSGEKITPDPKVAEMCIKAVEAIPGLNFAGVDIMQVSGADGKKTNYLIEINSNPGEKIIGITGHNHYEDLIRFVEKAVGFNQNDEGEDGANVIASTEATGETLQDQDGNFAESPDEKHEIQATAPTDERDTEPEEKGILESIVDFLFG